MQELHDSLRRAQYTTVGSDDIHYQILKHLPKISKLALLEMFNTVWINKQFSTCWI